MSQVTCGFYMMSLCTFWDDILLVMGQIAVTEVTLVVDQVYSSLLFIFSHLHLLTPTSFATSNMSWTHHPHTSTSAHNYLSCFKITLLHFTYASMLAFCLLHTVSLCYTAYRTTYIFTMLHYLDNMRLSRMNYYGLKICHELTKGVLHRKLIQNF